VNLSRVVYDHSRLGKAPGRWLPEVATAHLSENNRNWSADWYVGGAPDLRFDNDMLHLQDVVTGNDFEAMGTSVLIVNPDSGQAVAPQNRCYTSS
jgi:hypothetical protein